VGLRTFILFCGMLHQLVLTSSRGTTDTGKVVYTRSLCVGLTHQLRGGTGHSDWVLSLF